MVIYPPPHVQPSQSGAARPVLASTLELDARNNEPALASQCRLADTQPRWEQRKRTYYPKKTFRIRFHLFIIGAFVRSIRGGTNDVSYLG